VNHNNHIPKSAMWHCVAAINTLLPNVAPLEYETLPCPCDATDPALERVEHLLQPLTELFVSDSLFKTYENYNCDVPWEPYASKSKLNDLNYFLFTFNILHLVGQMNRHSRIL